jgi:hypothetical protein
VEGEPSSHVGLGGGGPHFLGRHVAALELRVLLQALAERMPGIALDGKVSSHRPNFVNGIKHMPARFAAADNGWWAGRIWRSKHPDLYCDTASRSRLLKVSSEANR